MIPNALIATGAYADLWTHVQSMMHAVVRALDNTGTVVLTDYDRERLVALAAFLKNGVFMKAPEQLSLEPGEISFREDHFTLEFDLRDRLRSLKTFDEYGSNKLPLEKKVERLIGSIEDFIKAPTDGLFPKKASRKEFELLRDFLRELIIDTESLLQAQN